MTWRLRSQQRLIEFDPDQPRWPKGTPFGGRWRKVGAVVGDVFRFGEITPAQPREDYDRSTGSPSSPLARKASKLKPAMSGDEELSVGAAVKHKTVEGIAEELQNTESLREMADWVGRLSTNPVMVDPKYLHYGSIEMNGFWGSDKEKTRFLLIDFLSRNEDLFPKDDNSKRPGWLKELEPGEMAVLEAKAKRLADAWKAIAPRGEAPTWSDILDKADLAENVFGYEFENAQSTYVKTVRRSARLRRESTNDAIKESREALNDFRRTAAGMAVRLVHKKLSEPEGLARLVSDWVVGEWASTSSSRSWDAWWVQEGVRRTFGLPELRKRHPKRYSAEVANAAPETWERLSDEKTYGPRNRVLQDMLRIIYRRTQEQLPEGDSFVVYRGMHAPTSKKNERHVELNPLTSWAWKPESAIFFALSRSAPKGYSSYVATARVPRERIFSWPFSGQGCLHEDEVVVLGSGLAKVDLTSNKELPRLKAGPSS
jgi:hypothetical protein